MRISAAGSLPGTDFRGALTAMAEALPEVLPLPELPVLDGGMITRAVGLIDGLGFDLQPAGWRLTAHPSAEQRRAAARWSRDLDDAEELLQGFGGVLKVAYAGPWTLAATVERPRGDKVLADHGARRELAQALAAATEELRSDLARRFPQATAWLQVDEPRLGEVRAGRVATASGFGKHRAVDPPELVATLRPFAEAAVLHNCAAGRWLDLGREAGFTAAWVDTRAAHPDDLALWLDEGRTLVLGVVNTATRTRQPVDDMVRTALEMLRLLQARPGENLLLGTACGLAGWRQEDVMPQLASLRRAATLVAEALERG